MRLFRGVSHENLIELRELLFEGVKNIVGAGKLPGLCQQFRSLRGFPRTRHCEIPYRTFQSVRRSRDSFRVGGAQSFAKVVQHFWAFLQKYSRKLPQ
jgi:lysine/ornithine N-monooxygenase